MNIGLHLTRLRYLESVWGVVTYYIWYILKTKNQYLLAKHNILPLTPEIPISAVLYNFYIVSFLSTIIRYVI